MATIRTYRCRFHPQFEAGQKLTEYLVPVEWWAYADDRLDARCPATLSKAQVEVKAYTPEGARKLVWREWGDYGSKVGTAVLREVA